MPSRERVLTHLTVDRILEAAQADDYLGFCIDCGHEHGGVEPDTRGDLCERCRRPSVYGAEELVLMVAV